jgi:hypothetical protein
MKFKRTLLFLLLTTPALLAHAQSYYLLPENFYVQKGQKIDLRLLQSEDMNKQSDFKFQADKTAKFELYQGKKKIDLKPMAKDTGAVISMLAPEDGLVLVDYVTTTSSNEMSRSKFLRNLDEDDPDNIAEKVKNSNQLYYKETYTSYMKTLFPVEKNNGNVYEKPQGDEFEIVVQQDPYKFNYGDDISALILFQGKPLANAEVDLFVKTINGMVFPQKLSSDATGLVYLKLSREGIYILSAKHFIISKDKSADFQSWRATYTFAFTSSNEMPNTYREFGFGNKH